MANNPPPLRSGLSLYANLLDPSKPSTTGTISSAPVSYSRPAESSAEQDDAAKKQQALAASLRFQPTKRPQLAAQKAKARAIANKFSQPPITVSPTIPPPPPATDPAPQQAPDNGSAQQALPKTTIADWVATASDDDDVVNYYGPKRERGGRKKRKKNREAKEVAQDWDDIYDPSRPNSYEEYKNSEEKIREVRDWKDLLYKHRMKRRATSDYDSERSHSRPSNHRFAPPPIVFAPPNFNGDSPPPPPPADIPDDATGDDAYARRMRLSNMQSQLQPHIHPPPPPASDPPTGQISRAAVRYNLPAAPAELPSSEAELAAKIASEASPSPADEAPDQPRSSRPGQAGFAERLLSKYGWTRGSGLGASGTGITTPLFAKADKRKKKSDAEGGGFVTPATTGKILGGAKSKVGQAEEEGKFGAMSEVVRLQGMLKGLDIQAEMEGDDGGIRQEIGEECQEKYGTVERVLISDVSDDRDDGPLVFVQFVNQLSALRAVNALEGRVFNGNVIKATFWEKEKFEEGRYD